MKNAIGGLVVFLLCAPFLCILAGGGAVLATKDAPPAPTLTPTPSGNGAADVVREVGVIVAPIMDASAGAVRADTAAAHPEPERPFYERQAGALVALASVACLGGLALLGWLAFLFIRDRHKTAELEIRKAELSLAWRKEQRESGE